MGLTYFNIKDNENAKETFKKVIEIAPDSEKAELAKGYLELLK
jgi:Tfp pilus assembly protein PilF